VESEIRQKKDCSMGEAKGKADNKRRSSSREKEKNKLQLRASNSLTRSKKGKQIERGSIVATKGEVPDRQGRE